MERLCITCKHDTGPCSSFKEPCWTCLDDWNDDPWPRKNWEEK